MADHHQKQHPWPSSSPRPQQRQDGKILLHPVTSSPLATAETIYSHHSTSQDYNHVGDYEDAEEEDSDCISEEEDEEQDQEEEPWMEWFLKLPGHHLYLRVPEDYLRDDFNLTDLSSKVPYYKAALAMLLHDPINFEEVGVAIASIKTSAKLLFTLIHARYLNSKGGLVTLSERFTKLFYGTCPRYFCQRQPVLPVGLSDIPCQARVQVYCPSCDDVYQLPSLYHRVDGAAFGTSIPHVFFKSFRHYLYSKAVESGDGSDVVSVKKVLLPGSKSFGKILSMEPNSYLPPLVVYEPKIFGFSLYKRRTPNVEETSASSLRKYESFSLYPPGSNSSTGSSSGMPTHSKFGLSLDLYRHYIPNPMDMSWLRTKPNPYRGQFVNKE